MQLAMSKLGVLPVLAPSMLDMIDETQLLDPPGSWAELRAVVTHPDTCVPSAEAFAELMLPAAVKALSTQLTTPVPRPDSVPDRPDRLVSEPVDPRLGRVVGRPLGMQDAMSKLGTLPAVAESTAAMIAEAQPPDPPGSCAELRAEVTHAVTLARRADESVEDTVPAEASTLVTQLLTPEPRPARAEEIPEISGTSGVDTVPETEVSEPELCTWLEAETLVPGCSVVWVVAEPPGAADRPTSAAPTKAASLAKSPDRSPPKNIRGPFR
jgi:hypothetical protein